MNNSMNKNFFFFTSLDNYTGVSASNLKEFLEQIKNVEYESIEFHLYRGDFQKWLREVCECEELAQKMGKLEQQNLKGELLRVQIIDLIYDYFDDLKKHETSFGGRDLEDIQVNLLVTFESMYFSEARYEIRQVLEDVGVENPRFVRSKVRGLFMVHLEDDPKIVTKKLDSLCRSDPQKFRYTYHWVPVEKWTSSTIEDMSKIVKDLANRIEKDEKWRMRINKRRYNKYHSNELIAKLTQDIDLPNVDLENPDKTIRIEIFGNRAAISLLNPFEHFSVNKVKSEISSEKMI